MVLKSSLIGMGLFCCASVASAVTIHVPDGDVEALKAAIEQANETPELLTTIELAANGHYVLSEALPTMRGVVEFRGNSATLDGAGVATGAPLNVLSVAGGDPLSPVAQVRISQVHVTGLDTNNISDHQVLGGYLVGISLADVLITDSSFTDNHLASTATARQGFFPTTVIEVFHGPNTHVVLRNVTISGNVAESFNEQEGVAISNNGGAVRIENSTIVNNSSMEPHDGDGTVAIFTARGDFTGSGSGPITGETVISNSIIANNTLNNCFVRVNGPPIATGSLGHNIDSDGSCGFDGPGDLSNIDPKLSDLSDDAIPVHHLLPGSPALDAGDNARCPVTDAQGRLRPADGDGDGTASCDIGAVEEPAADGNGPGLARLAEGLQRLLLRPGPRRPLRHHSARTRRRYPGDLEHL